MASLSKIVEYADDYLRITEVSDSDNALNGLQLQNSGRVSKIAAAVDASTRALNEAVRRKADLLLVHHGLFWSGLKPVTRGLYRQLKIAFERDLAVYSAHLPLDLHPDLGNNAELGRILGLRKRKFFLEYKGNPIGVKGRISTSRDDLMRRLKKAVGGRVTAVCFGPAKPRVVGIVTGAAGAEIHRVADLGVDTFITGEAPHWAAVAAEELGINLFLAGHYATETFGVKALAAHLSKKFKVPWEFIECPTGL